MASPITKINPRGINTTGDYVVNSLSSTGNVTAGNIKTDHLLYANGTPYAFTTNAAGTNTQVQFNDGNSFAGSANLTFDKTTGTLTTNFFVGNGSQLTGLPASYTDTNANSAIDARVTKTFVDNLGINANTLNGHSDTYFATSTQGTLAESALQSGDNISELTNDAGYLVAANLSSYATQSYVGDAVANLVNSAPGVLDTLGEIANALGNDASFTTTITNSLANKANTADLSAVALSGNYTDLNGLPTLFNGEYASLANTPTLFNGEYSALANKPTLFSGSYVDLTNKPTLGTAAATDSTDYATAAQGTKADTALQSADLNGYATETYVDGVVANIAPTDLSTYATQTYVGNAIANLVASAPAALDTLNELAIALGNDASYSTTITNALANKLSTSDFTSTANTWISTQSTSDLAEGTNQYYTVTRANSAIDARVTKSFIDNLAVDANTANVAYSVSGSNVSGQVANALVSGTVYTNAQPNITSVGTLANLTVSGAVVLGSVSNVTITGGAENYVLSTDGTGNLSWVEQSTGGTSSGGGESTVTSVDTFTGDGTETVFTLSVAPQSINQTFINYNGALQLRSAYTLSGQDITFSEAPADGSVIEVTTQMNVTSGSGSLTVRNYTADGVQTDYTVSTGVNATNILVTENGLVQMPVVDYTVTGSTLSFVTAPGYNVKIQIRELGVAVATITPVGSNTQVLFNDGGSFGNSAQFTFNKSSNTLSVNNISVTGNIVPTANVTYDLGNSTNRFRDLFLSGNTIDLGGAQIKTDVTSGAIAFVPPATVAEPNPTALVISSTGGISTASTTNGVLAANAITVAAATGTLSSPRYITMHTTGNISASTGTSRYYPPGNVNINNVSASLSTAPTANMTFQLCKNGSNVGAFTISANSYTLTKTSANITLSTSDYLTVNIVSGDGNDLRMDLQYVAV